MSTIEFEVTEELIEEARVKGWNGGELMATAMKRANPSLGGIEISVAANPNAADPALRGGYVAGPVEDDCNAPVDAVPDPETTFPERYAVLFADGDDEVGYLVYRCYSAERGEWYVVRTYLRDASGIHSDPRMQPEYVAENFDDAWAAMDANPESSVAMPVSVARQILGDDIEFAPDGYHPTLCTAKVP
jgi:hypothetical protein